jgi:two-component system cell cycle response regulator DivK
MAKVLAIDDSASNLRLTVLMLEMSGYAVLQAIDATSGLALAHAELPDLILMDIILPGMSGLEAVALLKSNSSTRAIPIVALTALAMKGDEEHIRRAGCDGYIAKPLHYQELWRVVAAQLAKRAAH